MYQFFVEPHQVGQEYISIFGDDVNHIKNVLRMKLGTRIRISVKETSVNMDIALRSEVQEKLQETETENASSFFGIITEIFDNEILVKIESQDEVGTELSNRIYLFQGLPKGDKMELIIQKAVELGVYQIIPVAMKNCVVKLDEKKAASKVKRWQAISESAAKQSKRTVIPEVKMPLSWKLALKEAENLDVVLVPYENERGMEATREILKDIPKGQSIGIFVGPEGGFSSEEIEMLAPTYHRISLGRRILRTETAGLATLSMLVFCLDE